MTGERNAAMERWDVGEGTAAIAVFIGFEER